MNRFLRVGGYAIGGLLLGALPSAAVDGVREINMSCAAVGCWPGDDPGLPVQIVETGSYRLTGGLVVDQHTTAIRVTANDVSIDLNGFTIKGPGSVTAGTTNPICSVLGTGIGIDGVGDRTLVRNGSIIGTTTSGVRLGTGGRVADVSVEHICGSGIVTGDTSSVTESRVRLCSIYAIAVGNASRVAGVIADFSLVGIWTGTVSIVADSVATSNYTNGVRLGSGSVVSRSSVSFNGIAALDDGIASHGGPSLLMDSFVGWNGLFGFRDESESGMSGFGGNVFAGNGSGGANTGANTQCNVVNGTSFCPSHP